MKKIIALLLALTMVFAFAACAAKTETPATTETTTTETTTTEETKTEETPAAETTDEVKTYKVGVAIYQFDDNFMTLYRNELKSYMESLQTDTVKYDITIVDGKNDMATQTEQINSFITQGVDLIICNLVQTSSADTIVNKVVDAGIPLVLINREPLAYDADGKPLDEAYEGILNNPGVCYVGADARQSGTYQGEIVAALPDKGDANGDGTISIADITAILDYLSVTEEEQAQMIADRTVVEDALDADGSGSISIADVTAVLEIIAGSAAEG